MKRWILPLLLAAALPAIAEDRPFFGVNLREVTEEEKKSTGLAGGAVVDRIVKGGAAEKAGLKPGDVIGSVDGKEVLGVADFKKAASTLEIGKEITLSVFRNGVSVEVKATPMSFEKWSGMMGEDAPPIEFKSWVGEEVKWEDLKGKVIVIDFFQIICPGCEAQHPQVEELAAAFAKYDGVKLIGVHTAFEEFEEQTTKKIKAYVKEMEFTYPVGIAKSEKKTAPPVMDDYRTGGTPCLVVVDREGKVRFKKFGEWDLEGVKKLVEELAEKEGGK